MAAVQNLFNNDSTTLGIETGVSADVTVDTATGQSTPVERVREPQENKYISANHQFQSKFTHLGDLKFELSNPAFDRVSMGTRGLVSTELVSDEDFALLQPWEVPGLVYDFGDGLSLPDATALLTGDRLANSLGLPGSSFSLKEVNSYIKHISGQNDGNRVIRSLSGKMNTRLGQIFYLSYQWADPEERVLTDLDIHSF